MYENNQYRDPLPNQYENEKPEFTDKQLKKIRKILKAAGNAIGGGLGLIILQNFFPEFDNADKAKHLFSGVGLLLLIHGVLIFSTYIFRRKLIFKINQILVWIVMWIVVLKLLIDVS